MPLFHAQSSPIPYTLCLLEHTVDGPMQVSVIFEASVEESRSGIESREPDHFTAHHLVRIEAIVTSEEAAEIYSVLSTIGAGRIGVPIWDDIRRRAEWSAARIFATQQWINIDRDTGAFAINADAGHPETVGLLIGSLKGVTRPKAIGNGDAIVEITVEEDSPWSCRIEPNTLAMPTFDLVPAWTEPVEDSIVTRINRSKIGQGREYAVTGEEAAPRRLQRARFALCDSQEIRKLYTHFCAARGEHGSFAAPVWYEHSGAETKTWRYAEGRLDLSLRNGEAADVEIAFQTEVPLVGGRPSQDRPARTWLYKVWFGGDAPMYLTSWEAPVSHGGNTYTPEKIQHMGFEQSLKPRGDDVTIKWADSPVNPLGAFTKLEVERRLFVEIRECDPAAPAGAVLIFVGRIMRAPSKGKIYNAKASTFGGLLRREIPAFEISPRCQYCLFDELCGVAKASHKVLGTVSAKAGLNVDVTCSAAQAADWFAFGWALFGSGATAERRAIVRSTPIAGGQRLTLHKPLRGGVGTAAEFYPGCDGQFSTGCAKFGNQGKFGGFPTVPAYIETVSTGFKTKMGK